MIKSFGDERTERIFSGVVVRKLDAGLQKQALRRLRYIDAATAIEDLRIPPANRLEKLQGDLKDFYSIRVNDQFRLIFRWDAGNAYDVEFIDYH